MPDTADTRLIERWLPISALGIESTRERTPMTPFPAPNRLHVWWARRPLVASRAAVLASLLPADTDRERFLHVIGIHGDSVAARDQIDRARRTGVRVEDPYGYERAFKYAPTGSDSDWLSEALPDSRAVTVLDPTAGGGSVPFETLRTGFTSLANDLNPVAALVMRATIEWPSRFAADIRTRFDELAVEWRRRVEDRLGPFFPQREVDRLDVTYLWARTVTCPYCDGLVPLSPNWRLAPDGTGVRLLPDRADGPGTAGRICGFEIVGSVKDQFPGTVARGDGHCPYSDCGRVIDGDEIKRQAQAGRMGEQLFAVVYKRRVPGKVLKSGKRGRDKWVRGYREPRPEDDNGAAIRERLAEKLPEWEALDLVPSERFPEDSNDDRPIQYGMPLWRDLFSPRQLLCHGTSVEVFREMLDADRATGKLDDVRQAAYGYLALSLDKLRDYNSRLTHWHVGRQVVAGSFDRHDFAFKWSYVEMAPLVVGLGYDWAIGQTAKCIDELVALIRPEAAAAGAGDLLDATLFRPGGPDGGNDRDRRDAIPFPPGAGGGDGRGDGRDRPDAARPEAPRRGLRAVMPPSRPEAAPAANPAPPVTITCKSGDSLDHIADASIDAVVMDPPYYDNVMYAELSDFFYVWLKRTAGHVFPELFRRKLTDKENEAVANPARFAGQRGARALAGRDYQQRMAAIFAECRRVLKADGVMTLMFTHKATGAWDALTTGLIEAGFVITASWPVNTEAEGSLHIRDKAAANSTIFLVCRPRAAAPSADPNAGGVRRSDGGLGDGSGVGPAGADRVGEPRAAYGDEAQTRYWEDVEPAVARAVRTRVEEFQDAGIGGVDLYLASFGPALEEFSRHWPLRRGTPRQKPEQRRQRQRVLFEEPWDAYAVTPEDALDAARREVKRWRLSQLTHVKADDDLDPLTAFFVLAWDAFKAPVFAYDEALRLARAVGVDLEGGVVGRVAGKKASDLHLWDSARRAAAGALGPADGSRGMIDALHHAAHAARARSVAAAVEMLARAGLDRDPRFFAALEAVLEVLPPSKTFTGIALEGAVEASGSDFEALYNLYRLAYDDRIDEPDQLRLWREES